MIDAPAIGPLLGGITLAEAVPSVSTQHSDLKSAAQRFEAIFIRQMLSAARASEFGGEPLLGGPGLKQFNAMHDDHIAQKASESGAFGFSKLIEAQLASQISASSHDGNDSDRS